jgi:ADP-heptose:LPS heptosyltransferase
MSNLNLVILVDTAPVYLAGALGCPVWTILPYAPDWRWMLDRDDSPWHPTMRLFRQKTPGDWAVVIQEVEDALKRLLG